MNYKMVIIDEAKIDFRTSLMWYKDINPKLSQRFYLSLQRSLAVIKKDPLLFQVRYNNVRIKMLTTFPYLIHYTVHDDTIVVLAIYHSSRNGELNIF